ncbi:hypothetical protein G7066_14725 [Leucobacter coleopterorum]|uniref:LPXTG-motif cell wall anchor domain-containing protein n=1 Tax=Leucobacter coleopterorum TaxID=2714933 RepID=A0ABX6JZ53_9MICO|nr:Ig-like domain-containing protein [Leucobacter coleopterorum]QIM19517.1 hypothetical protein G7066_14725 [Leucobacter coleopterorum]
MDFTTPSAAGYDVVFTVTDSYDNTFTYTGKYVVTDTKAPSVTVGKDRAKHKQQSPETPYTTQEWLTLFEVTAKDTKDGSGIDPANWVVTEGVNYTLAGEYEVEFVAHDRAGNASKSVKATLVVQAPPTSDSVHMKIAQNKGIVLDPKGRSTTSGELKALTEGSLGEPSAGGAVKLDGIGGVIYTPAKDYSGQETLMVTVTDDLGQTGEIAYTFTVVKKGTLKKDTPEYSVPVDGTIVIPTADVLHAVDVSGLEIDQVKTAKGFVGKVKLDGDTLVFTTDGSNWRGDETFTVTLKDELGQTVEVPVTLHVTGPTLTTNMAKGYAGASELKIDVQGLVPGQKYTLELHSKPMLLGTVVASAEGTAQLVTAVPAQAKTGSHSVVLLNAAAQQRASAEFEVLAKKDTPGVEKPQSSDDGLSRTGGEAPGVILPAAIALLLVGLLLLGAVWLRRRKRVAGDLE